MAEIETKPPAWRSCCEDSLLTRDESARAGVLRLSWGRHRIADLLLRIEFVPAGSSRPASSRSTFLRWDLVERDQVQTFEFVPPNSDRKFLAAARPIIVGGELIGAAHRRSTGGAAIRAGSSSSAGWGWPAAAGLVVALGLVWYMSRRITKPVLALSHAADEVAASGYDVDLRGRQETRWATSPTAFAR